MILTICPNPSIDCTIELDSLNVGMLNRVSNKVETYAGKALNVAMGIARLGEKSFATGFMFEGQGSLFEKKLAYEKVDYKFVYNKGNARVNYKIIDKKSMLTEINDRGDRVEREKQLELISLVKELSASCDIAVMSGSLPQGVDASFYDEVLKVIPNSVKKIVDTEKINMLEALKNEVYLVKPKLQELEKFSGITIHDKKDMIKASLKYIEKGVKYVLISLGADGAILTNGSESYYCKSANIAVNSTVGAGDYMLSAGCIEIERGSSMKEMLCSCVSAGTAGITTSGNDVFYMDKYKEILSKVVATKI